MPIVNCDNVMILPESLGDYSDMVARLVRTLLRRRQALFGQRFLHVKLGDALRQHNVSDRG
jgi:hypothetical protein